MGAIIIQFNIMWYRIHHCSNYDKIIKQTLNSCQTSHTPLSWASYGVSFLYLLSGCYHYRNALHSFLLPQTISTPCSSSCPAIIPHQFTGQKAPLAHLQLSIKWEDTGRPLRDVWMERWAAFMLGHLTETEMIYKAGNHTDTFLIITILKLAPFQWYTIQMKCKQFNR